MVRVVEVLHVNPGVGVNKVSLLYGFARISRVCNSIRFGYQVLYVGVMRLTIIRSVRGRQGEMDA